MGLSPSLPALTRSQRQDELVKMCPGGNAKVTRRPKTNPDGSEIVCRTDYEFPDLICDKFIKDLYKAMRLGPEWQVGFYRDQIQQFCGIDVDIDNAIENGSATSPNLVEQN
ncbi:uncharacterized protein LOC112189078 [Rosa chinensis]|uniref:uncharacterized protein LOC112189078 n=1 Tax=Rosa chinensis TaxID=74649 RepID=UPI000D095287|nr:uncharacterized protein LOC112189078 [Rosa chinensis]